MFDKYDNMTRPQLLQAIRDLEDKYSEQADALSEAKQTITTIEKKLKTVDARLLEAGFLTDLELKIYTKNNDNFLNYTYRFSDPLLNLKIKTLKSATYVGNGSRNQATSVGTTRIFINNPFLLRDRVSGQKRAPCHLLPLDPTTNKPQSLPHPNTAQ